MNDGGMPDGKSVERSSIDDVIKMAELIVRDGDMFGTQARHPTTILTRLLIERLASELRNKLNDEFVANRE